MYADDLQLLHSFNPKEFKNIEECIRSDVIRIGEFMRNIKMKLNQSKTTVTKFGNKQQCLRVSHERIAIGDGVESFD